MTTITRRSVIRWQIKNGKLPASALPPSCGARHPTKKATPSRMRHFEDDGGRFAKLRARYEYILHALYRNAA